MKKTIQLKSWQWNILSMIHISISIIGLLLLILHTSTHYFIIYNFYSALILLFLLIWFFIPVMLVASGEIEFRIIKEKNTL